MLYHISPVTFCISFTHQCLFPALPAALSPKSDHGTEHRVTGIIKAVSPPVIVMASAAPTIPITTTHLVGSQKRKARKQCITRLDPENVRTSRGKLKIWACVHLYVWRDLKTFDVYIYHQVQLNI